MLEALPKSFQFKMFSSCLAIAPFGTQVTNAKLIALITVNVIIILTEIIIEIIMRKEIFAFVGQPVLMVLDCVAIIGPIFVHIIMISETLLKRKSDRKIWKKINKINTKLGKNSITMEKKFERDFYLVTFIPLSARVAVILAAYRTQPHWALSIMCTLVSGVIFRWGILMFIYYARYIGDKLSLMAQEIDNLKELTCKYEFSCDAATERLWQMKNLLNLVWDLHYLVNVRYEILLVCYVFLSLCGLTTSMYFLSIRLIKRSLSYAMESAMCLIPFMYTNVHMSYIASDFNFKVGKLFNSLQLLGDTNWKSKKLVTAVKSYRYQLVSAKFSIDVGGHLKIDYSTFVLGTIALVTTNVFIFLFFN